MLCHLLPFCQSEGSIVNLEYRTVMKIIVIWIIGLS